MKTREHRSFYTDIFFYRFNKLLSYGAFIFLRYYEYLEHVIDLRDVCEKLGFRKKPQELWISRVLVIVFGTLWSGFCLGSFSRYVSENYSNISQLEMGKFLIFFACGIITSLSLFQGIEYVEYRKMWKYLESLLKKEGESIMTERKPMALMKYVFQGTFEPLVRNCFRCDTFSHSHASRMRHVLVGGVFIFMFSCYVRGLEKLPLFIVVSIPIMLILAVVLFMGTYYIEYAAAWKAHYNPKPEKED